MGCVGVGYDDREQRSVMCFLCEHQWAVERATLRRKDGGCPMMRCAWCHKTFRWGLTSNSLSGVIEADAPRIRSGRNWLS